MCGVARVSSLQRTDVLFSTGGSSHSQSGEPPTCAPVRATPRVLSPTVPCQNWAWLRRTARSTPAQDGHPGPRGGVSPPLRARTPMSRRGESCGNAPCSSRRCWRPVVANRMARWCRLVDDSRVACDSTQHGLGGPRLQAVPASQRRRLRRLEAGPRATGDAINSGGGGGTTRIRSRSYTPQPMQLR